MDSVRTRCRASAVAIAAFATALALPGLAVTAGVARADATDCSPRFGWFGRLFSRRAPLEPNAVAPRPVSDRWTDRNIRPGVPKQGLAYAPEFTAALRAGDAPTWRWWVDRAVRLGDSYLLDGATRSEALAAIRAMPRELRAELLERAVALYPQATVRFVPLDAELTMEHLSPKRALDAFITDLLETDGSIGTAIANGAAPIAAYRSYLDRVRSAFRGHSNYGAYSADDVLAVARAARDFLRTQSAVEGAPKTLIIGGSLVNGRAKRVGSDFDIAFGEVTAYPAWPPKGADPARPLTPESVRFFRGLGAALERDGGPAGGKRVEFRPFADPRQQEYFFLMTQPVILRVTAERIELQWLDRAEARFYLLHGQLPTEAPFRRHTLE